MSRKKGALLASAASPETPPTHEESDLASDLMVGAKEIASFIGRPEREVYYLASIGRLPVFSWGSKLASRKSTLRRHIVELEKSAARTA